MKFDRRAFLSGAAVAALGREALAAPAGPLVPTPLPAPDPALQYRDPRIHTPVETPDGATLGWRLVGGVKVFHLVAAPIVHTFAPGLVAHAWGYNGRTPGPTIELVQGDRVRFYVTNHLPEPTTVHWHGILLPNGMDGVMGVTQRAIRPGETYRYEFTVRHAGTFMYHPHADEMTQMGLGLMGMIVVHPSSGAGAVDRDFAMMLSEWEIPIGASRPDPREMTDFNVLTINSKAFPGTSPLVARTGQRVRIRIGNLSAMHNHPIHLHGYTFEVTATDGGSVPPSARHPEVTVLVPVGATRDIELRADAPGDWPMHCHFTHHIMNQMGHAGPNLVGIDAHGLDAQIRPLVPGYMTMGETGMSGMGEMSMGVPPNSIPMRGMAGKHDYIDMGGMFTLFKVRDRLDGYADPGWYENPPGTLAVAATAEELARDGIDPRS